MCGIHGFISGTKRNPNADDFVKQGFVAGSLRGTDASGLFSVDTGNNIGCLYQKLPVPGPMFITDGYAQKLMRDAADVGHITVCHTRSTTTGSKGGISDSHPFLVADTNRELIGVHNGTLTNWYHHNKDRFKVDSEFALNHIFEKGSDAFKDFFGSYCFVWWDSDDSDILNIALNAERPMNIAFTSEGGMAFASEPGMLYWLMERNRIKIDGKVGELQARHHYKFNVNDLKNYTKESLPATVTQVYAPAQQTTAPHRPTGTAASTVPTYNTTMDRVDAMLARITNAVVAELTTSADVAGGAVPSTAATTTKSTKPQLMQGEIAKARELQVMSKKVLFEPLQAMTDTGEIWGIVYMKDTEFSGVIRNAGHIVWQKNDMWDVSAIGARDDGNEITIVCGHPDAKATRGNKRASVKTVKAEQGVMAQQLAKALGRHIGDPEDTVIEGQCSVVNDPTLADFDDHPLLPFEQCKLEA